MKVDRHFNSLGSSSARLWKLQFYLGSVLVVIVSLITIQAAGPTVFTATYASESGTQLLGNTQNIGIICLLAMFVALNKLEIKHGKIIFWSTALFFLGWAMFFRGLRQDVVTTILGLTVCYGLVQGKAVRISRKNFVVALAFIAVVEFMGAARALLAIEGVTVTDIWTAFTEVTSGNLGVYHFGTVSPIATTFANTVYLIDNNRLEYLLGQTYLEFIARTPPEFLYPDRPEDYAWIFPTYGLESGGGFFELAEAYINFGLVGAFFLPGILSYLLSKSFFNALAKQSNWSYFLLFTFLGIFLRGTWYQVFAFYKSFLTAIILYFFFLFMYQVFLAPFIKRKAGVI